MEPLGALRYSFVCICTCMCSGLPLLPQHFDSHTTLNTHPHHHHLGFLWMCSHPLPHTHPLLPQHLDLDATLDADHPPPPPPLRLCVHVPPTPTPPPSSHTAPLCACPPLLNPRPPLPLLSLLPQHFDSDATLDGRRVTAIIYLNDGWRPGSGGELRLYPFPAPPVDVEPLADRMCLFASTSMLHRCGWLELVLSLTRGGVDLRMNLDCCAGAAACSCSIA